ncbi:MAG TPA: TetR/AcrR family transcriptional regulator [Myxococcota bacterium]|nr:TetR/AcrR family transcriptional regulator [Myxococcota bacterium]
MPRGSSRPRAAAPAATPRHGKRARTRQQLLDAALRVLARVGTGGLSIQEITAEAGVANGTFYNYFRTREELLEAAVVPLVQRLVARVAGHTFATTDPALRLAFGVRAFISHAVEDPTWAAALLRIWGSGSSLPRRAGARVLSDLRAAQKKRRLRIPDEDVALDLVQGTVIASIRSVIEGKAGAERGPEVAVLLLRAFGMSAREADALAHAPMPGPASESPSD